MRKLRYLSLFSGIEAATVAWEPIGFEPVAFAEIEPFPRAVLKQHYPSTPNLGDITQITEQAIANLGEIDLVVFGSPCQDLSIAGKQTGLLGNDGNLTRSGLFFRAFSIFEWAKKHGNARYALWENVPGAFSSNKGRDFAAVVSCMAGLGDLGVPKNGWATEGCAVGDNGMLEWCCLDAQWRGLAQRRNRVFAILDTGDWANRPPILLEPHSLRGDTPPSRKTGQEAAGGFTTSATTSSREPERSGLTSYACGGTGTYVESAVSSPVLRTGADLGNGCEALICYKPLFTAGFSRGNSSDARGIGYTEEGCPPLRASASDTNQVPTIVSYAFEPGIAKREGNPSKFVLEQTSTLRADMGDNQIAVAFAQNARNEVRLVNGDGKIIVFNTNAQPDQMLFEEHTTAPLTTSQYPGICAPIGIDEEANAVVNGFGTLRAHTSGGAQCSVMQTDYKVRRLTPKECARLQGFPDSYLDIAFRNKPAADGNKYKALGNSMAVPVMHWIGQRIQSAYNFEELI